MAQADYNDERIEMEGVRLPQSTINAICAAFKGSFLEGDHLWLFGSRTDLSKRGGDIDLYIESSIKDPEQIIKSRSKFRAELYKTIGEQKIDVVVKFDDTDLLIYQVAKQQGIQLL